MRASHRTVRGPSTIEASAQSYLGTGHDGVAGIRVTADFISLINGAVAQWRDVRGEEGLPLGRARVPDSDWLRKSLFDEALRNPWR